MKFKLIKLKKIISILRYLLFTLLFVILFSLDNATEGILLALILNLIILVLLIKRYKIVGLVILNKDNICIDVNTNNFVFELNEIDNVIIEFYGFKGEIYSALMLREGISKIVIKTKDNNKYFFYFIVEGNERDKIDKIKEGNFNFKFKLKRRIGYLFDL